MDSSGDFSFDSPPNLDFNPSVDAEMKEEEDGWRDETARSSISHGLVSIIISNLLILGI